jgi:hypothetical protein
MRFFCSTIAKDRTWTVLMVEAPDEKLAEAYAKRALPGRDLIVHPTGDAAGLDVELRLVDMELQCRRRMKGTQVLGPWERV